MKMTDLNFMTKSFSAHKLMFCLMVSRIDEIVVAELATTFHVLELLLDFTFFYNTSKIPFV